MPGPKLDLQGPAAVPAQADSAYFSFSQMRVVVGATPPAGMYVAGTVEQGTFVPTGKVEGEHPTVMGQGQPGWVELGDGSFHGAMEGRPPFKPYLEGTLYNEVGFVPTDPNIRR